MRKMSGAAVAAIVLLAAADTRADPITVTADRRGVDAAVTVSDASGTAQHSQTVTQPGNTVEAIASASTGLGTAAATANLESSFVDPLHMRGSGKTAASWGSADAINLGAHAKYDVSFTLTQPFTYVFQGTFDTSGFGPRNTFNEGSAGLWGASLNRGGFDPRFADGSNFSATRTYTGALLPGEYFFNVNSGVVDFSRTASGTGTAFGNFAFTLDLTPDPSPTPEPASLLLMEGGLALALTRQRCLVRRR